MAIGNEGISSTCQVTQHGSWLGEKKFMIIYHLLWGRYEETLSKGRSVFYIKVGKALHFTGKNYKLIMSKQIFNFSL